MRFLIGRNLSPSRLPQGSHYIKAELTLESTFWEREEPGSTFTSLIIGFLQTVLCLNELGMRLFLLWETFCGESSWLNFYEASGISEKSRTPTLTFCVRFNSRFFLHFQFFPSYLSFNVVESVVTFLWPKLYILRPG